MHDDAVREFAILYDCLAGWPHMALPEPETVSDGIFARILQILRQCADTGIRHSRVDLMVLLRHVLRRQAHSSNNHIPRLKVPAHSGWPDHHEWSLFGITAQSMQHDAFLITATPWSPDWVEAPDAPLFEDAFAARKVRQDMRRPIDPFLANAANGFDHYLSPGQKEAVRSALLLPRGKTLIVGLPTGSGKSFIAQAPVLARGIEGPVTICVVPTTALAMDQARQTGTMMKARFPHGTIPALAWHAGLNDEARRAIKTAIRRGQQGILYCSPEAVTGALLPALYDAAEAGLLAYFVIDEAHLLNQWGDGFRPAFQMLAGIRRGLLERCAGRPFRTILMSATFTPDTLATIDALFGPVSDSQMVATIHLRPEPQYWIHQENDEEQKNKKILEALCHAPRPAILYVTKRDDAKSWLKRLRGAGFTRCASFHGETPDTDRMEIINRWANNEIDLMVATSAFGVGIDKSDVRTVIHATVPETLDRFYQEVGRGGRDGRTSASLLVYSNADRTIADRLAAPGLISNELAFDHWQAMSAFHNSPASTESLFKIDLEAVPKHLNQQTDYNTAWNMRTLIMMARAGMLELESRPPDMHAPAERELDTTTQTGMKPATARHRTTAFVRVRQMGLRNRTSFNVAINAERTRAIKAAQTGQTLLDDLLGGRREISNLLSTLYTNKSPYRMVSVTRACGGCPFDRHHHHENLFYRDPPAYGIRDVEPPDLTLFTQRFPHLSPQSPIIVAMPEEAGQDDIAAVLSDLVSTFGINEVAIPDAMRAMPAVNGLYRKSPENIVLLQSLEEEMKAGFSHYRLARVSVVDRAMPAQSDATRSLIESLMGLERPLHLIVAPPSAPDPFHPTRRLVDTGTNILTYEHFRAEARR